MKKLFLVALLALATVSASAAEATLQYTALQLKGVQWKCLKMNQARIAEFLAANPDGDTNTVQLVTPLQYVQTLLNATLDSIVREAIAAKKQELLEKYEAADAETKTEVETHLNVTP